MNQAFLQCTTFFSFVLFCQAVSRAGTGTKRQHSNSTSHMRGFHHDEIVPNNTNVMEVLMAQREVTTFQKAIEIAKRRDFSIRGFYHTSAWQTFWKDVVSEQLNILDGKRKLPDDVSKESPIYQWDEKNQWTSLLAASDSLYMNVAGPKQDDLQRMTELVDSLKLTNRAKIELNYNQTVDRGTFNGADPIKKGWLANQTHISEGEYATVTHLQNYCKAQTAAGKKALVYYMHNKGGCCFRKQPSDVMPVAAWREEMNAMTLEFPSICLRALMKGYSTCGVENQDGHYSGNFWWADCAHVANIGPLFTRFDAWAVEFFVLKVNPHDGGMNKRFGYQCGYSVHNCGLNLYDHECKREFYREKIFKYVSGKIGPNMVATTVDDTTVCKESRKQPYSGHEDYLNKNLLREDKLHGGPAHRGRKLMVMDDTANDEKCAAAL